MKCHEVRDLLSEYIEKKSGSAQYGEVADHLSECAECRREMEELQDMLSIVHAIPRQEPVFDLWNEFAPKFAEINASIMQEQKTAKNSLFPRLIEAVGTGWSMFICITGYNTARKIRYMTGAE